jgi:hypothetical protein
MDLAGQDRDPIDQDLGQTPNHLEELGGSSSGLSDAFFLSRASLIHLSICRRSSMLSLTLSSISR